MSPSNRLPSLNALRAFEAVSRHLSFAKAADELHVTKAAVAQQVRLLEAEIGSQLVLRSGRGLRLTEVGAAGTRGLADGFDLLARAARSMREATGGRMLVVSADPSFASTWLVSRIGRFKHDHPEIDVLLDANRSFRDLSRDNVDAAVRWGRGDFPNLEATLLFDEHVFPVCSPGLRDGPPPICEPADLRSQTLIHLEFSSLQGAWPDWQMWLAAADVTGIDTSRGLWFNHMSLALQAAVQGQGVALTTRAIAADELMAGRLVRPFEVSFRTPFGYYFVCRRDRAASPKVLAFRNWLVAEAARSRG
ncbi:MAG: transcriptional regulator GcvA [Methylobacteriaceae bacterium]|nr:transcriptional regulator GcvA [Methylobacteriaceae bacterium]MBV9220409.1 transcriptional regulator GcvA [Methylobacteriaceae bacterium]